MIVHAPGDAGGRPAVRGVPVQHAGREVAAERHPGEAVDAPQFSDAHRSFSPLARASSMVIWPGWSLSSVAGGGLGGCHRTGGVVDPLAELALVGVA
jgi:hypothetical protein